MVGPSIRLIRWGSNSHSYTREVPRTPPGRCLACLLRITPFRRVECWLGPAPSYALYGPFLCCRVDVGSNRRSDKRPYSPLANGGGACRFVVMASVIALTPGGLGVNELTSVTALRIFGTPLAVGAQWALANRALIAVSYFIVAICAVVLIGGTRVRLPPVDRPPPRPERKRLRSNTVTFPSDRTNPRGTMVFSKPTMKQNAISCRDSNQSAGYAVMQPGSVIRRIIRPLRHTVAEAYRHIFRESGRLRPADPYLGSAGTKDIGSRLWGRGHDGANHRSIRAATVTAIDITPKVGRLFRGNRVNVTFCQESVERCSKPPAGFL